MDTRVMLNSPARHSALKVETGELAPVQLSWHGGFNAEDAE